MEVNVSRMFLNTSKYGREVDLNTMSEKASPAEQPSCSGLAGAGWGQRRMPVLTEARKWEHLIENLENFASPVGYCDPCWVSRYSRFEDEKRKRL